MGRTTVARFNGNGQLPAVSTEPRSRFTPRVIAVILILLLIFLGWTFFWLLYAEREALRGARRDALQEQVNLARSVCRMFDEQVDGGQLMLEQAQAEALRVLQNLRYGPQDSGYFYVLDHEGQLILHPYRPDLLGRDVLMLQDANGQPFIQQLLHLAQTKHDGFTYYKWQWLQGGTDADTRLACVGWFRPWDWALVTDMTTADIETRVADEMWGQIILLAVLTLVLSIVISTTLRRLVLSGVDRLIEVARRLKAGELSARAPISPTDELGPLAVAINQMAEGIQARDEQIHLTQRTTMLALAKLAEARDNETGNHLLRVREYAKALALALAKKPSWAETITPQFVADLYDASILHDIGKVGIPDHVLLKPDVLDEGEMAIMMSHTLIGANTIRMARQQMQLESSFLDMAEVIARSHHERWDGQGYVERLSGEAIPVAARLFSVADVYDALTRERPYKLAYSHEQAVAMMLEDRGKRFDPVLLDAFLDNQEEFNRIRREWMD